MNRERNAATQTGRGLRTVLRLVGQWLNFTVGTGISMDYFETIIKSLVLKALLF
jgi:hypothetical protein